jgi:hypothetical protein
MGGQTSYQLNPDVAVPGMLGDENLDSKVRSFVAGEAIPFGRLCEVDSGGLLHPVQGSGSSIASNKLAGVSVFDVAREQQNASGGSSGSGFYASGEAVPVMRKGVCFGAWDGSTQALSQGVFVQPYVNHPSTSDANGIRGVFSGGTLSTAAGAEITQVPAEIVMLGVFDNLTPQRGGASANSYTYVCKLELNLPGA